MTLVNCVVVILWLSKCFYNAFLGTYGIDFGMCSETLCRPRLLKHSFKSLIASRLCSGVVTLVHSFGTCEPLQNTHDCCFFTGSIYQGGLLIVLPAAVRNEAVGWGWC